MARPVVGIIGNQFLINEHYVVQGAGAMNLNAVSNVSKCTPLIIPTDPNLFAIHEILDVCDAFVFTGARANVHPEEYGEEATEAHGEFDRDRDTVALSLVRACVDRGQPFFGICRGFQEVNVAMGGSLYPEIRDLEGRDNHRMPPDGTLEEKFELRHEVTVSEDGPFAKVFGSSKVFTNTLHGQGIKSAGPRVVVDGYAHDGTPEAIYIKDAPGFTLSVQWHPEWNAGQDKVSRPLFEAFGDAARIWSQSKNTALSKSA